MWGSILGIFALKRLDHGIESLVLVILVWTPVVDFVEWVMKVQGALHILWRMMIHLDESLGGWKGCLEVDHVADVSRKPLLSVLSINKYSGGIRSL